jgi:hypothetical protein
MPGLVSLLFTRPILCGDALVSFIWRIHSGISFNLFASVPNQGLLRRNSLETQQFLSVAPTFQSSLLSSPQDGERSHGKKEAPAVPPWIFF